MSGSVNKCIILGNLCADTEVKSFANGGRIANMRIATNERWKTREGEQKERVEYHSVVLQSDGLVSVAERFLKKGSKVYIEGKLTTRKWSDQSGNDRYSTEVHVGGFDGKLVMLDSAKSDGGNQGSSLGGPSHDNKDGWGGNSAADLDDEIPF